MQVERRRQKHVYPVAEHLRAHGSAHLLRQAQIPGSGERRGNRKRSRMKGLVRRRATLRIDAQPRRAVGNHESGNAQARDRKRLASGAGNAPAALTHRRRLQLLRQIAHVHARAEDE